MKKDGKNEETIPEDNPEKYKHAVYVMVMKVKIYFEYNLQMHLESMLILVSVVR